MFVIDKLPVWAYCPKDLALELTSWAHCPKIPALELISVSVDAPAASVLAPISMKDSSQMRERDPSRHPIGQGRGLVRHTRHMHPTHAGLPQLPAMVMGLFTLEERCRHTWTCRKSCGNGDHLLARAWARHSTPLSPHALR